MWILVIKGCSYWTVFFVYIFTNLINTPSQINQAADLAWFTRAANNVKRAYYWLGASYFITSYKL